MRKTVDELLTMYEEGKLHLDHSTQREFIYNDIPTLTEDGQISKAGDVIKSILERDIQLPALYFWNVQDDKKNIHYAPDEYNIHDGKQRFLSILYFIFPANNISVVTNIYGTEQTFKGLSRRLKDKLLNYTLDIVERVGTEAQEEESFIKINTSAENLTEYESLKGAFHGDFIHGFEQFVDKFQKSHDKVSEVGRGKQAISLLHLCLGTIATEDKKERIQLIKDRLREVRNRNFNEADYNFKKKLEMFSDFCSVIAPNGHDNTEEKGCAVKVCQIVNFILLNHFDEDNLVSRCSESSLCLYTVQLEC